jgi:hypothetical protein
MFGSSRHCSLILIAFIASPFGLQRRQSMTRQTIYRGPVFEMARRQFDGVAALAIALEELMGRTALAGRVAFLEELPRSPWDPGVLLPEATPSGFIPQRPCDSPQADQPLYFRQLSQGDGPARRFCQSTNTFSISH